MKSSNFKTEGDFMLSNQERIKKNPQFFDLNSEKGMPKSVEKDSVSDVLNSKFSWAGVYSSVTGEEKTNSKQSNSGVESNCQDSSLIDLKLGRFHDKKDVKFKDNPSFSSAQSSVPRKRAKSGNSNSQTPFCQVEGCNKDLSACKDYNKRHKVCEIHSKTAKVHVNGSEQRFCQQCSRFHSLSEFDDGKRSCRKRLAGHNERRRKNHVSSSRRLIPPYNGTNFLGSSFAASSFVCPNVLHSSHLQPQKQEINNWNRNQTDYDTSTDHPHGIRNTNTNNDSSRFHDTELIPMPIRSKENEHYTNSSFMTNMSSSDFDSLSLFQNTSGGNVLDDSSSFHGVRQPSSSSSCALSLLSSQSRTQTSYISSNIIPTSHYSIVQMSGNPPDLPPHPTTTNSVDESNMDSLLISDHLGSDKYGYNEFLPGSSGGDDSTIDLLDLSSQLHHVENERHSMEMKQENDPFFGLRIT